MKLSVVILNYNVRYFLELCIKSVETAIANIDAEIIVVDNQSSDDSCQMVKDLFPKVKLIENDNNEGFSKGNNIGVAQAKGKYVCILNPDTVLAEDTFEKLFQFINSIENIGIVGCKLIDGTGKFLPESKRNVPTPKVALQKIMGNTEPYYVNRLQPNETGKVDILVGAFMMIKREVYNQVKGFDEDYFMYGEDIDLSYKVIKAGYNNYYFGGTTVIHYKGESTLKDRTYAKRFNGSMHTFFKKHFKKHQLFDWCITLGVKTITLINPKPKRSTINVNGYVLFSDANIESLKKVLSPIRVVSSVDDIEDGEQLIFDSEKMSFSKIIQIIEDLVKRDITFKIHPKNSQFIIGSNSSVGRGEIVHLGK
ncbi:glycosyltransferase family 2 protein [Mangrovimonas aestuarii]|uniref:glycosyltransferase family 2 protein n=1 Tax=Mangrovimonas aestuarii TaxID=3018443 RepID=UPI002378FEAF|nr:glycosyltransferase family 2 protein [Mangrovimonas aestuarii]